MDLMLLIMFADIIKQIVVLALTIVIKDELESDFDRIIYNIIVYIVFIVFVHVTSLLPLLKWKTPNLMDPVIS